MKNIYILPTDKPSRLYEFGGQYHLQPKAQENFRSYHIYITNDEEIKEGEEGYKYCSNTNTVLPIRHCKNGLCSDCKKIILTIDPDLIKDGIQAIDDEFLEWFVKNPSCESVEVEIVEFGYDEKPICEYKIIIPKEEPKQFTTEMLIDLKQGLDNAIQKSNPLFPNYKHLNSQETLEEAVISKERLEKAFLNAKKHIKMQDNIPKYRATGFLEGILFASNELEEGKDFVFKDIEYEEIGWFGGKTIKTRKQTYSEFIIEKFENFLKKII
jgi:hypothetical protein